jgi:AraC-like DNA-binding protein
LYLADDIETEKLEEISADDKAKLKTLYLAIQEYFEKERPYCNSDFNVVYLANKLNTNVSYVSRAIKFGSQTNFNQFINQHRVNLVISMLNDGDLSHYTMLHIYTKAGFKYQSTFNSAFRKVMNMTPSEYIASKKIEN